jgi:hypothetical protein
MKPIFGEEKTYAEFLVMCLMLFSLFLFRPAHADNLMQEGLDALSGSGEQESRGQLSRDEIAEAFKQALHIGSEKVVSQLGQKNGFYKDPAVHIPLPEQLDAVKSALEQAGLSHLTEDLEVKLNRAAEAATPAAEQLFLQAVADMSFEDVMQVYKGPSDAATRYFQRKMAAPLAKEMKPIIETSLSKVGAIESYDQVMGRYTTIPFVPDVKADLADYVTKKAMEGIFHYMAKQEAAIRKNPARQTTELLERVFMNR